MTTISHSTSALPPYFAAVGSGPVAPPGASDGWGPGEAALAGAAAGAGDVEGPAFAGAAGAPFAGAAGAGEAAAPAASSVMISEPSDTLSPILTLMSLTVPAAGEGTSIV